MRSMDPTYPLFPVCSFIAFIVALIPIPWHAQAMNSGTCAYMAWCALACLNLFINSIVWKGSFADIAPVWCDISSKIYVGVGVGIPASILCISRRLYTLISIQRSSITKADKRRMVMVDLLISVGIPVVLMAFHYIVQGHRYDILQDIGCYPVVYNVVPAYPLYYIWSPLLGAISFVYSALIVKTFWKRRAQFSQLVTSNSGMSISRYLRLMALAMVDMLFNVPLGIFVIVIGTGGRGPAKWVSWEDTHFDFSRVEQYPAMFWRSSANIQGEISVELTRWLPVFCSFIFFALFGFASEAQKQYRKAFWAVAKPLGVQPKPPATPPKPLLPSWVKPLKSTVSVSDDSTFYSKSGSSPSKTVSSMAPSFYTATDSDVELYASQSGSTKLPPPPRYSSTPLHLSLDMPLSPTGSRSSLPNSPTSVSTTVVGSATHKGDDYSKGWKPSLSIDSLEPAYTTHPGRRPRSHPSHSSDGTIGSPGYHRPFSPPLAYPSTTPHPRSSESVDGIHMTVETRVTTSSESLRF
ncbi:pheromone receptor [Ephemerocybe angulata]|uniref:Pheromone receptor n=1 Tax=Ephemerocybe angulata TaxID=980116 RepID=A0A8H6HPE2_9AGAR|nr:pheromone receptor [Tulosesus angulatus]